MNRRTLLTRSAVLAGGALAYALAPRGLAAARPERQFRAQGAELLFSEDSGRSWRLGLRLPEHLQVLRVWERSGVAFAQISVGSHRFLLKSPDGVHWRAE